ncbi:MAG TPA: SpoIIE family protein phosphatase [Thermoanaerobaculia bacterium]
MKERPYRRALLAALGVVLVVELVLAFLDIPYVSVLSRLALGAAATVLLAWLLWRVYKAFLWKVGRRLAFSYFLIGVLPIPMVLLLLGIVGYILSGFFLGHLYRDAALGLQSGMEATAEAHVQVLARTGKPPANGQPDLAIGYYRQGRRISGDPRTPAAWPRWADARRDSPEETAGREAPPRFFARGNQPPTLAAAASRDGVGVLILYAGNLDREIRRRSDLWVEIDPPEDPSLIQVELGGQKIPLRRIRREQQAGEAEKFFKRFSQGERIWDDPVLWWADLSAPMVDLATGKPIPRRVNVMLNSTPRAALRHLFSTSGEVDSSAWAALLVIAALLFDIYIIAAVMAIFFIVGLSRAVNLMSQATTAVREGDFSVRIPVRRKDQLGELQRSFNEMAANLETLVAAAAQKEILEKELAIARDLQKSLIPTDLPTGQGLEFATLFEPSAAIGGDYFDILRLSEEELAVIVADVSGHGLSSGLRMAMVKAALLILVEETAEPQEILRRLDKVVRGGRAFVTATLGIVDLRTGLLRLTNAGHPPTYVLRRGAVREVMLPSSALGGLGHSYAREEVPLELGDVVVWLSDGLIEAADARGEPFGYETVVKVLEGIPGEPGAAEVRNRLLAAVERHVGAEPPNDDRTMVVMRWRGPSPPAPLPQAGEG